MLTIYGVPFSAHTRKVILTANLKNLEYKLEPVVPMNPPENWSHLSPAGKIPAMQDGDFILSDSSVICAYLERKFPQPPIYPQSVQDFARALWFEEYVDNDLQQFVLHHFLFEAVFAPAFLQQETNWEVVNNALDVEIPKRFANLEQWVSENQYLVADQFSIADITLVSILINYSYGGKSIDGSIYPNLAGYFQFVLKNDVVRKVLNSEYEAAKTVTGFKFDFLQTVV